MPINGIYTPYDFLRIDSAIAYIEKNYWNAISADNLAIEVNMNIKLLQAGFQMKTGLTIHHYQMKVRVEKAAGDLFDYSKSVKSIARKHGFSSSSHFGQELKRRTGKTAREHRRSFIYNHSDPQTENNN